MSTFFNSLCDGWLQVVVAAAEKSLSTYGARHAWRGV